MQLPYGLAQRLQKTVETSPVVKFLSPVQVTLHYIVALRQELLFQLWVIFSPLGRTTARMFLSLRAVVCTELFVLVVVTTLAQRKSSFLLEAQVLLPLILLQAS